MVATVSAVGLDTQICHWCIGVLCQLLTDVRSFITVTLDESNRTWGRSTIYKPEEFDDVKKGIKKKGRTWGPSSVQTKERGNCAERYRTLVFFPSPFSISSVIFIVSVWVV